MTLKEKATITRQMSAISVLAEIQQKVVSMTVNGFDTEPWFPGSILTAMKQLDKAIDEFAEDGRKIQAEAQAKANGN